jgi:hypothetical protein
VHGRVFIQTMITLASAALGFVCALAWNEAIKAAIIKITGVSDSLAGLFTYAIIATIIAVVVLVLLGRAAQKIGSESAVK